MSKTVDFFSWCDEREIKLLPHQRAFCERIANDPDMFAFFLNGIGSGRTFASQTLERYADEQRMNEIYKTPAL